MFPDTKKEATPLGSWL